MTQTAMVRTKLIREADRSSMNLNRSCTRLRQVDRSNNHLKKRPSLRQIVIDQGREEVHRIDRMLALELSSMVRGRRIQVTRNLQMGTKIWAAMTMRAGMMTEISTLEKRIRTENQKLNQTHRMQRISKEASTMVMGVTKTRRCRGLTILRECSLKPWKDQVA